MRVRLRFPSPRCIDEIHHRGNLLTLLCACIIIQVVVPTLPDLDPAAVAASEKAGGMRCERASLDFGSLIVKDGW